MIKCNNEWPISVCSWSLGNDLDKLNTLRDRTDLNHLNLGLGPALDGDKTYLPIVQNRGWEISATMLGFAQEDYSTLESIKVTGGIVPDDCWEENRKRTFDAIDMTAELGVQYLLMHFGFLEMDDTEQTKKLCDRIRIIADRASQRKVQLLMETGQEAAAELRQLLELLNHPALVVNLDPANMILYNKDDPLDAVKTLAPWIKHVHIKDALRTETLGTWGREVVWGTGQVGADDFLKALKQINFTGALAIEREAGDNRLEDIITAVEILKRFGS